MPVAPSSAFDPMTVPLEGKILVEASAGTGKTHAITSLFVRLVAEAERTPSEILVVTFTEAATAELRTRVRARLVEAREKLRPERAAEAEKDEILGRLVREKGLSPATLRERLERALGTLDEASISTIHGFCRRLLHDHALGTRARYDAELVADLRELEEDVLYDFFRLKFAGGSRLLAEGIKKNKVGPGVLRKVFDTYRKQAGARTIPDADRLGDGATRAAVELELEYLDYSERELAARKERASVLGFDDLLEGVARALTGPGGVALGRALSERYKVALVNEFQDTDRTQCTIFEAIFARPETPLFLIGDPKQAIYGFRGADVWSYLALTRDARRYTLDTSYRSDPGVVKAVNMLFGGPRPFLLEAIEHRDVSARPGAVDQFQAELASNGAQFEILFVESPAPGVPLRKPPARAAASRVAAAEVAALLGGRATIAGHRVVESDIAVITRTNLQCFDVQEALRQKGIVAVVIGDKDVLESDEAEDLILVLPAVLDPTSGSALRRALASALFGQTADDISRLDDDAARFELWAERLRRWQSLWTERGFMRMFRALLEETDAAGRLLSRPGGERRITNFLHLAELCHRAESEEHLGPQALYSWLVEQREEGTAASEHAEIRLESDRGAVRVLTAHKAKGLEFPVVVCPFAWDGRLAMDDGPPKLFHDEDGVLVLDLNVNKKAPGRDFGRVKWEAHAEERRVLYVALTRAKHRVTLLWLHAGNLGVSAAATLLHPPLRLDPAEMPTRNYLDKGRNIRGELEGLAERSAGVITLRSVPFTHDRPAIERPPEARPTARARRPERPSLPALRTGSFSALTHREIVVDEDEATRDHDQAAEPAPVTPDESPAPPPEPTPDADRIVLDGFPRGRRAGDFFHHLLEKIDFSSATGPEILEVASDALGRFGLARGEPEATRDAYLSQVVRALDETLRTPLSPAGSFCLADITPKRRQSELEFRLPVAHEPGGEALTRERLAAAFRAHPSPELPESYAERVARLAFPSLRGFLKGYIDLVFCHEDRWYVVNYKTNHLGDLVADYDRARMTAAMAESHYFLQYHLYTLAVSRILSRFVPGFDYERDFGGALYLFLKGMRPGAPGGIFYEKPPLSRLIALSSVLGGTP